MNYYCPPEQVTPCLWSEGCVTGFCQRQSNAEHKAAQTEPKKEYLQGHKDLEESPSIQSTLAERGARYGDWTDHADIRERLIKVMQINHKNSIPIDRNSWIRMEPYQRQALITIADKIARILNGDPNYDDNWRDIAGYATLVLERLPK